MSPEIVFPVVFDGEPGKEILKLGKCEKSRGLDDVDPQNFGQTLVVEVEGVLKG